MLLRPVTAQDVLFLASVLLFALASIGFATDRERAGHRVATLGWGLFAVFWATTVGPHLGESRTIHAVIVVVTVCVSLFVATLAARRRDPVPRLTLAFTAMAAVFVPFQFVAPINRAVLESVTSQAAWTLSLVGFYPYVGVDGGLPTVIYFPRRSLFLRVTVVSACSGISAISLFAGLVAASHAPLRRRFAGVVAVTAVIYALNVGRVVFVAGSLGGSWFAGGTQIATVVYGVTDPAVASFLLAEHVVSQILVIAVLFGVYLALLRWFPDVQSFVGALPELAREDLAHLRE